MVKVTVVPALIRVRAKTLGRLYRTALFAPSVLSFPVAAVVWLWLFNPTVGFLNAAIGTLGLPPQRCARVGAIECPAAIPWVRRILEPRLCLLEGTGPGALFPFAARRKAIEVAAGAIKHAVRFTVPTTRQAFVLPATHWASSNTSVASIDAAGLAFTLAAGTTIITAALGSVVSPNNTLTVTSATLVSIAVTLSTRNDWFSALRSNFSSSRWRKTGVTLADRTV